MCSYFFVTFFTFFHLCVEMLTDFFITAMTSGYIIKCIGIDLLENSGKQDT